MKNRIRKYILTGGPCVGKSTLLKELQEQGFYTIGEAATYTIEQEKGKKNSKLPWTDRNGFQELVLEKQLLWEKEIPEGRETFLDRGILDGLAYYRIDKLAPPKELKEAAEKANYNKVFLIEPLKRYERNSTRREEQEQAKRIHKELYKTYSKAGYKPIRIPAASLDERIRMILKEIRR